MLFRVRICLFPLFESTPYLRTANISEPPFRGFSRAFPALETPLNQEKYSMYPLKFGISPKRWEKKRKNTPFFKKSRVKSQIYPFFYNSRAGLCCTKSTPLPDILATRMRSFRNLSGGPGIIYNRQLGEYMPILVIAAHNIHGHTSLWLVLCDTGLHVNRISLDSK